MIDLAWFAAIARLHRQYPKEMFVVALGWGLYGVACGICAAAVRLAQ